MQRAFRLTFHASIGASFVPYLRRYIGKAHQLLAPPLNEFSIALVNDRRMSDLHVQFMNIPGPTDVLTFPLELNRDGKATAGEVILCVPEARRRAKEHGVTVKNELLLYALHGMLHLSGFDDRTARGFARMHRTEDDILQRLGVGPVFRRPSRAARGGDRR
jgi:probable rRNA maturation factor